MTEPLRLWVWAVRHIKTGEMMPARVVVRGGWSHWNPGTREIPYDRTPRIFCRRAQAVRAAAAWSAGPWSQRTKTEGDWEHGYSDYLAEPAPIGGDHGRSYKDLEVVRMRLQEVPA